MVRYATKKYTENMARAIGDSLPISTKQAIEICGFIRGKTLVDAKGLLDSIIQLKSALPLKRFHKKVAHKKKMGAGRYPVKSCKVILKLLESVEANAQFKGLNTANLVIVHMCANKASTPWHYGRIRGRKMKRTNVEVVVEEKAVKKKEEKVEKKEEPKAEEKKEPAKEAKPTPAVKEEVTKEKTEFKPGPQQESVKEKPPKKPEQKVEKKQEPKVKEKKEAPKQEEPKVSVKPKEKHKVEQNKQEGGN